MFPQDFQLVLDPGITDWVVIIIASDGVGTDVGHTGADYIIQRAVVICHPTTQPAAFIARFPGVDPTPPLDLTASGRVTESVFTAITSRYEDEPVLIFTVAGGAPKLMLPQELQSTGDDVFRCTMQTGLQAASGELSQKKYQILSGDTSRLEAVEIFQRRGVGIHPGTATMTVAGVASNVMDVQAGTVGTAINIPGLNSTAPVKAVTGVNVTGRFFGLQIIGSNVNSLFRYLGAILRGRRLT